MNTGGLIVACPAVGDPTTEGIEEPHITMLWFGEAANLPNDLVDDVRESVDEVSAGFSPFQAQISGVAMIGEDKARVYLVESEELADLRRALSMQAAVREAWAMAEKQFPFYVPHMTISYEGALPDEWPESMQIDALGLWLSGVHERYTLSGDADDDLAEMSASGFEVIPPVRDLADLTTGIQVAERYPSGRWYVAKRATALGAQDRIPVGWGVSA